MALKDRGVGSQRGLGSPTTLASAQEDSIPKYDLSIPLGLPRQQILAIILEHMALEKHETALAFDFAYQNLAYAFRKASTESHVQVLEPYLHDLRHGVASRDRQTGDRPLLGVPQRGNWRSFNTVLRYATSGRVLLLLQKPPASVLTEI